MSKIYLIQIDEKNISNNESIENTHLTISFPINLTDSGNNTLYLLERQKRDEVDQSLASKVKILNV